MTRRLGYLTITGRLYDELSDFAEEDEFEMVPGEDWEEDEDEDWDDDTEDDTEEE